MDEIRANRVTQIKETIPKAQFTHVSSKDNPADLPSRGCYASELRGHSQKLWLYGPDWLGKTIPEQPEVLETTQEMKRAALTTKTKTQGQKKRSTDSSIIEIEKFNEFTKLVRILIICKNVVPSSRRIPLAEMFTRSNIQWATKFLVKLDQRFHFFEEINNLDVRKQVSSKSPIVHLYPFLDKDDQILKVGGRLAQSNILSEQQKFPIILSHNSHLANLIIKKSHVDTLHGGPTATVGQSRQQFWITRAYRLASNIIIFRPYFIWERKIFKSNGFFFFYKICQDFIYI